MVSNLSQKNYHKLRNLFIEYLQLDFDIEVDDISQESLGEWTSVRHLGLIMDIEAEFGVRFIIDEVTKMSSFQDIIYYLQKKIVMF